MKKKIKNISPTETCVIDAEEENYLYVHESQIPKAGQGLFTAIDIYKDEVISIFKGEILDKNESKKRALLKQDEYFIMMLDGTIMDSKNVNCFAKFANDCEGIIKSKFNLNAIISIDENFNVCLVAKKSIKAGEEIFCSYGKAYWKNK